VKRKTADIYALKDPRTGEVRYIGKANCAAERLKTHMRESARSNRPIHTWLRRLSAAGLVPLVEVVAVVSRDEWQEAEKQAIAALREQGGHPLNVADGGDEPACPPSVRKENARRTNKARREDPVLHVNWLVARKLGKGAEFMRHIGDSDAAKRMRVTQSAWGRFAAKNPELAAYRAIASGMVSTNQALSLS
jgi:hypothetical protein